MLYSALQRFARACGWLVISRRHVAANCVEFPPETAFDRVLLRCHPRLEGLRFIQIGANDGRRCDPIARYVDRCQWIGVMFEPLAANFAALEKRHHGNPRLRLRRAAVDQAAGQRTVYDLDRAQHPALPDWAHGLGSFSRERVLTAARELGLDESAIIGESVETVGWNEVWRDLGPGDCDVLLLDTEGYDLVLLRAADLARHRPRVVHFEHACVSREEQLAFYGELLALGYEIATDGPDTTAWRAT
jgi:FkbM family methyltransferase